VCPVPLPPNPYVTGVQLFGDFAHKIVVETIRAAAEQEPGAQSSFDLASRASAVRTCPSTTLRHGLHAVMFSYDGDPQPGMIALESVWHDAGRLYVRQGTLILIGVVASSRCAAPRC
jgi:hypothetical protein